MTSVASNAHPGMASLGTLPGGQGGGGGKTAPLAALGLSPIERYDKTELLGKRKVTPSALDQTPRLTWQGLEC